MGSLKCVECGLNNFAGAQVCRRCDAALIISDSEPVVSMKRKILKILLRSFGLAGFILFIGYASLISTSEAVVLEQRQVVDRAIDIIDRQGFGKEAFVLRNMVRYRKTDNWWNRYVGHESAYASTNFPFQVVTLYPSFFDHTVDDVERAAILLHEAYHLFGRGEQVAFAGVWEDKKQLGWTKEKYAHTPVWTNVRDATLHYAPEMFKCGQDGRSDCTEEIALKR